MTHHPVKNRPSGFTLLELVIAIGLLSILVGMVFSTARTSLALGNTIVQTQNEEMLHQAFFELLGQRFSSLPGNTRLDLKAQDAGSRYTSDLTLQNVPLRFTWGGAARTESRPTSMSARLDSARPACSAARREAVPMERM